MKRAALGLVAVTVVAGALLWFGEPGADGRRAPTPRAAGDDPLVAGNLAPAADAPALPAPPLPGDEAFVGALRARFASRLDNAHAQIKLVEQVIAYLMATYPDDWQARVRALLERAFPEHAAGLHARFEALIEYNDWLRAERSALTRMPAQERRAALWAARRAAFGADAEAIWAAELRDEQLQQTLQALDATPQLEPQQKMQHYLAAIHETWGEEAPGLLESRRTELLNRFVETPSMQQALRELPAPARGETLQALRREIGMDAAALSRWSALDAQRDAAWDSGTRYSQERRRILGSLEGEAQRRALEQLQESTFGADAETIRAEEAAGFFRYEQPRRIGRE